MKSRLSLILFMIFLVPLAVAWTPPSNINLWDYYNITNGSYVSADAFLQNGNLVIDNTSIANTSVNYSSYANSSTYWDDETSQADLNVNSSTYWDSETSQADLNVNSSTWWASVSSFVARWFYDDSNVLSFNETRLNATIDDRDTDTVWTRNDTWIVNESGSLSWNETSGDSRYYTQTAADAAFIAVGDEGNLNVNSSTWWASVSSFASRWFDDVANVLTFNETLLNSTIDTIDLATNASMKTYVDAQDVIYNDSMVTYVDAQDVVYNDSLVTYIDAQDVVYNDSMVTYVDLQDVYYNESLKNYSDDTFQIEIGAGCSGGTPVMTAVNNDGSVNCTAAGAGDITDVNTDVSSGYLAGGQDTGQVNLSINETKFDDDFWNRSAGVSAFVNRSLWTSIDNYANDCVSPDIMRGVNDTLNCITPDSTAQCTGDVCGGGHTHPASEVTAGTFGAGDYVMGSDLTVERLFFENGTSDMFITAPNSTTMEWRGITASIFLH